MTCAECRDLLLDLAYGELPPDRAAELEAHVAQCPECSEERARLDRTRRLVAPLRMVEEPPASFDEPILRAARAEATMQSDGTPGEVVEVSASVKPLGLQPARVDPHGEVNVARRTPGGRWIRRLAVAGSVAAAASLALVVGVSLRQTPLPSAEQVPEIRVQAPVVPSAVDEARRNAAPPPRVETGARASAEPAATAPAQVKPAPGAPPIPTAAPPQAPPLAAKREEAPDLPKAFSKEMKKQAVAQSQASEPEAAAPAPQKLPAEGERSRAAATARLSRAEPSRDVAQVAGGAERGAAADRLVPQSAAAAPRDVDAMETSAETSRHAGRYEAAAQLYQSAAAARRSSGDATRAAWNLAHAVECLAAASRLDDAKRVRDDLLRDFPEEAGARRAADRALGYPQR